MWEYVPIRVLEAWFPYCDSVFSKYFIRKITFNKEQNALLTITLMVIIMMMMEMNDNCVHSIWERDRGQSSCYNYTWIKNIDISYEILWLYQHRHIQSTLKTRFV